MAESEDSDRSSCGEMNHSVRRHARRRLMDLLPSSSAEEARLEPNKSLHTHESKHVRSSSSEVEDEEKCKESATPRGLKELRKKMKAQEDPETLKKLVMQRHPDMEFQSCKCDLVCRHTIVGLAEHEGVLYIQVDDGLDDGEVVSLASDVVGTFMGVSFKGETPRICARNDKEYVRKHMDERYSGIFRPALNGDGAVVEAFNDPPGLRDYIQRRRKELRLAVERPRISLFHAKALIREFLEPDVEFNWAALRVMSLKKVIIDSSQSEKVTSNKQFLSDYVILALDLKKKWKSQVKRPRSENARPAAHHETMRPEEESGLKKRKVEHGRATVGGESQCDPLNKNSRKVLDPSSSVRTNGTGSERPASGGCSNNPIESMPDTVNLEATGRSPGKSTQIDHRNSAATPAGEVINGSACARKEQLEEEIGRLKELRDFAVKHFENNIRDREVQLENLALGHGHDSPGMEQIENSIQHREEELPTPASGHVHHAPPKRKTKRKLIWDVDLTGFMKH